MPPSSGWKTLSSKYVYENPWIKVKEDKFETPEGKKGIYGVVECHGFALIIPKVDDSFFLIETYRYTIGRSSIEFPAGGIEAGESVEITAARELQEETGLITNKLTKLGFLYSADGFSNDAFHVFLAEDCQQSHQLLGEHELGMQVKKYSVAELKYSIQSGQITDSPTVSAFCLYQLHMNSI